MHSKTGDVQALRHDLRNGPAHVFGAHSRCNPEFCKHVPHRSQSEAQMDDADTATPEEAADFDTVTFTDQLDEIISQEMADKPTAADKADAQMSDGSRHRHIGLSSIRTLH